MKGDHKAIFLLTIIVLAVFTTILVNINADANNEGQNIIDVERTRCFRIVSRQGWANKISSQDEISNTNSMDASLLLHCKVMEVEDREVKFKIEKGTIIVGGRSYTVRGGHGWALVKKFGWMTIRGTVITHTTTAADVADPEYKFNLEGMLHIDNPRLIIVGLSGILRNSIEIYHLRFITLVQAPILVTATAAR